jgi:hypothetical protein
LRRQELDRRRILFITYSRVVPTGQLGVFKRCIRLFHSLFHKFEIHLVNYGPLPETDAVFALIRDRVRIHSPCEDKLGSALTALIKNIKPDVIVFGETPLRGNMWISHRVAVSLSIPQICIDNYYGDFVQKYLPAEWPYIDRWLLIGLLRGPEATLTTSGLSVVPPLVTFPSQPVPRDRVCVLGYDEATLRTALKLLGAFEHPVDYLTGSDWDHKIPLRPKDRVFELPSDSILYDCLVRAKLVIGKAGFQQIVEAICLGAPIVCRMCGGGVDAELVPDYLRPFIRFIGGDSEVADFSQDLHDWLCTLPFNPWPGIAAALPEPTAYAAAVLTDYVNYLCDNKLESPTLHVQPPLLPAGFSDKQHELFRLVERKDWTALTLALVATTISVDGTVISPAEFCRRLSARIGPASDVKLLPLARISSDRHRCCVMTIDPESWSAQDLEFDIQLRFDADNSRFTEIVLTAIRKPGAESSPVQAAS